jgi:hypothetical protein
MILSPLAPLELEVFPLYRAQSIEHDGILFQRGQGFLQRLREGGQIRFIDFIRGVRLKDMPMAEKAFEIRLCREKGMLRI